ncbi:unnamed protein product, partial [Iphiclides podalirius]
MCLCATAFTTYLGATAHSTWVLAYDATVLITLVQATFQPNWPASCNGASIGHACIVYSVVARVGTVSPSRVGTVS